MRKCIIPLFFASLLCSCASQNEYSSQSDAQSTTEISSQSSAENATQTTTSIPDESLNFIVDENGVNIMRSGEILQTLECDYIPDRDKLIFEDYDFDGYNDLFISMDHGAIFAPGTYFHYNSETSLFEKWNELNIIGCEMIVIDETSALRQKNYNSDYWLEYYDYKWKNNRLILFEHIVSETGEVIETYSVDEYGNETLVKRERAILDDDNNWLGTEEVEIQPNYSFSVNGNSVDVIHDGELVQTLECTPLNEDMLISDDYNFDGHDDLFVITDIQDVNLSGTYYKFNPETSLFEKWEELNRFGYSFDIGISSNVSIGKTLAYDTDDHEKFIYKWDDDELILVEKRITVIDKENNKAITELYYIDADGIETLIESSERDLNENPLDFD